MAIPRGMRGSMQKERAEGLFNLAPTSVEWTPDGTDP